MIEKFYKLWILIHKLKKFLHSPVILLRKYLKNLEIIWSRCRWLGFSSTRVTGSSLQKHRWDVRVRRNKLSIIVKGLNFSGLVASIEIATSSTETGLKRTGWSWVWFELFSSPVYLRVSIADAAASLGNYWELWSIEGKVSLNSILSLILVLFERIVCTLVVHGTWIEDIHGCILPIVFLIILMKFHDRVTSWLSKF
jgi:hypothetical protein